MSGWTRTATALSLVAAVAAVATAQPSLDRLTIVAPAAPGGGWDQTARALQYVLEADRLVSVAEVQNVPGAAGTIGLSQFINSEHGNGRALLISGLVMLGATLWNRSPVSVSQVTPIARLTGEYEVIAVPASSPHRDLRSLVAVFRERPESFAWGGGSAGGTDHILAGLVAEAAGIDARRVNYIAFSGGGEAVAALLGGHVAAGISGYSEFAPHVASGRLRAIAISARSRVAGIDVGTMKEGGVDVELVNWRAVLAPAGISERDRARLSALVRQATQSPQWRQILAERNWTDMYLDGAEFEEYLRAERTRLTRVIGRLRGPADGPSIPVGERVVPLAVLAGAVIVVVALVVRSGLTASARTSLFELRPGRAAALRAEADKAPARRPQRFARRRTVPPDNSAPHIPPNRTALALVFAALVAFAVLLPWLGFIVAASVLFSATASAFRPRPATWASVARVVIGGFLFSALVFLAFTRGLDLSLPVGSIWTWMR